MCEGNRMKVPGDKKQGAPLGGAPEAMMSINETVSYFPRMLTAPEIMAGGVTGATIGVTGATIGTTGVTIGTTIDVTGAKTDVTDASVGGAIGAVGPTDVAGINDIPWAADVTWGSVVPFEPDVVLLAITAGVVDGAGVARTGI